METREYLEDIYKMSKAKRKLIKSIFNFHGNNIRLLFDNI